jgi:N-hydroxyarylamine O-acetyltransferase
MDVEAYLGRIGYTGSREPTLETLRGMQRAHFYSVPFENLDIHLGTAIEVDGRVNFEKIVTQRRGGFCLELNGAFIRVLREMGFTVDVIGARVMSEGRLGEPFSHMSSIVHLDEPWVADVGFGGRIAMPLRLHERGKQDVGERSHVIDHDGDHWFLTTSESGTEPMLYVFTLEPRDFDDFQPVCQWLQTSPDSHFTQAPLATLAMPNGRITLAGDRLITIKDGQRSVQKVPSADAQRSILKDRFGLVLPEGTVLASPHERAR